MRYLRNTKLVVGAALVICGITLILAWSFHLPAREITRGEFDSFWRQKFLRTRRYSSPYAGIYHVEGRHKIGGKLEKVYITTHLDESEVKKLI
jgi:hypothetical protein